ncbi:hypothetical protein M947_10295 [Sulfurimonas hongkongensis]|uniref:DUF2231 domain-containing protein n=1 Tax=Sulfurimonas hongkongensis TaxID=1172190 RepID=T0JA13_9BACT|nr:DUF2231 domain-containing protein [Sulfurimonas hongkongensis]EQB34851.1 hypothetical protein M947_10295 [Sulfurimonas hongkongensis]
MNILHPPFVHFVVALPLIALFSQFTYFVTKDKAYSKAAFRIVGFAMLVSFLAIISGINDVEKIIENQNIVQEGISALNTHKIFGFVVVAILIATSVVKWFAISKNSALYENISFVLIVTLVTVSLYQGRSGGMLVYKYSAGIDNDVIIQRGIE